MLELKRFLVLFIAPEEQDYIKRALQQIVDDAPPGAAEDLPWLGKMTEGELLHNIWGVAL